MEKKYTIRILFPTLLHEYNFDEINRDEIIEYCYERKKIDEGMSYSNCGGWHSSPETIMNNNIITKTLGEGLKRSLFTSIDHRCSADITYWININPPKSYNTSHTHPDAHFTGVIWIKIPKDSGDLRFDSTHEFDGYVETSSYLEEVQENTSAAGSFVITPEEGRMVTFPASLRHDVSLNESDEDRISISYNIRIDLNNK